MSPCTDDGSGFLDKIELAALLHKYHRKVDKTARPMKRIQKEVNEAIADWCDATKARNHSKLVELGLA